MVEKVTIRLNGKRLAFEVELFPCPDLMRHFVVHVWDIRTIDYIFDPKEQDYEKKKKNEEKIRYLINE